MLTRGSERWCALTISPGASIRGDDLRSSESRPSRLKPAPIHNSASTAAAWPFAFDSSQALRVRGNTLELTLSITNQSAEPAPAGLGWHPFFVKRTRSRIAFEATGRWEMGPDKLPTERRASNGIDADCATLDVDHCFDGWKGIVHLRDELLHTRVTSTLSRLVVFTNAGRDTIAIEPVSHVNNAINRVAAGGDAAELGLAVLQPGSSGTAQLSTTPLAGSRRRTCRARMSTQYSRCSLGCQNGDSPSSL